MFGRVYEPGRSAEPIAHFFRRYDLLELPKDALEVLDKAGIESTTDLINLITAPWSSSLEDDDAKLRGQLFGVLLAGNIIGAKLKAAVSFEKAYRNLPVQPVILPVAVAIAIPSSPPPPPSSSSSTAMSQSSASPPAQPVMAGKQQEHLMLGVNIYARPVVSDPRHTTRSRPVTSTAATVVTAAATVPYTPLMDTPDAAPHIGPVLASAIVGAALPIPVPPASSSSSSTSPRGPPTRHGPAGGPSFAAPSISVSRAPPSPAKSVSLGPPLAKPRVMNKEQDARNARFFD